jgi:hypothetical protein
MVSAKFGALKRAVSANSISGVTAFLLSSINSRYKLLFKEYLGKKKSKS